MTDSEWRFLEQYGERLDRLLEDISSRPGTELRAVIRATFRAETWRLIFERQKAQQLLERHRVFQAPKDDLDKKFRTRLEDVEKAMDRFAEVLSESRVEGTGPSEK